MVRGRAVARASSPVRRIRPSMKTLAQMPVKPRTISRGSGLWMPKTVQQESSPRISDQVPHEMPREPIRSVGLLPLAPLHHRVTRPATRRRTPRRRGAARGTRSADAPRSRRLGARGAYGVALMPTRSMEPLWSPAVATSGNRWQMRRRNKPQKQAKSVAPGCHRLPANFHGKEGVDGSSPSEGSAKTPHTGVFQFFISGRFADDRT
jgi:hypothetical protein